jgi:cyclopropane fatty-acyl-phospholipid synthase-like methyltransferase
LSPERLEKVGGPDFGTYHCSTPRASAATREKARVLFTKAFDTLPFSPEDKLRILDVGCGLGFLSCVCAEIYPKASVTGFDTFEHASLKDSSLEKAERNAEILGLSDRIAFQKGDIYSSDFRGKFDIVVSNLVFHNLGKKRFIAYGRLARWMTPNSFVVLGDLFFDYKADAKHFPSIFGAVRRIPGSAIGSSYRMLVLSKPKL